MEKRPSQMFLINEKAEKDCAYLIPDNYQACFDLFAISIDKKQCESMIKTY